MARRPRPRHPSPARLPPYPEWCPCFAALDAVCQYLGHGLYMSGPNLANLLADDRLGRTYPIRWKQTARLVDLAKLVAASASITRSNRNPGGDHPGGMLGEP